MKYALNPITSRFISPAAHALQKKQHGRYAICAACKTEVFDHSVGSLEVMPHFNHRVDSGPCPLKDAPPERDGLDCSEDGEALRHEFFQPESVQFTFAACQALVCGSLRGDRYVEGNFTVGKFTDLLHAADTKRTWCIKGLNTEIMAFALVANEIFDLRLSKKPNTPIRAFTFVLEKAPTETPHVGRHALRDPDVPVHLVKRFMNEDGTPGSVVRQIAPGNPYAVSVESAIDLAGPNWDRLPMPYAQNIVRQFAR